MSCAIRPCQVELSTFFLGNYIYMQDFQIIFICPHQLPTNHSLLACVCFFLCGSLSFAAEARRCVLFDAYATLSLWKDLEVVVCTVHVGRLLYVCSVGRLWFVCYGCDLRVSSSDTYHLHCSREMAIMLNNNFPIQSTLTPFCGMKHWCLLLSWCGFSVLTRYP